MYYRLYPSKNNTIFKTFNNSSTNYSEFVNTGENTVMELYDGNAISKLLFSFEIPSSVKDRLVNNFSCKLRLYDAGTMYQPALPLKNLRVDYFEDNFVEGSGWAFQQPAAQQGISNWVYREYNQLWSNVGFVPVTTYMLNKDNQDINIDVTSIIADKYSTSDTINLAITVDQPEVDALIAAKYIYSRHTRTVFRPYLEFFIEDEILDSAYNLIANNNNKLFFINQNGLDFDGDVTATVTLNNNSSLNLSGTKIATGVYYISLNPTEPASFTKKEYVVVVWNINNVPYYKQTLTVKPKNQIIDDVDWNNLFFYPTTPYTRNIVRQGDIMPFEVISQIRGKGDIVNMNYEYMVVSNDGFELIPWTKVSVYRNKMYFFVNTEFFYPEMDYEVIIRNNMGNAIITANTTFKFKLTTNAQSHIRELSASPYYSRETFFAK